MSRRGKLRHSVGPTPAECELFRAAVADVTPLMWARVQRVDTEPPRSAVIVRSRALDEAAALAEALLRTSFDVRLDRQDEFAWLRAGQPRHLLRDLRRGRWSSEAEIDLHGLNRDEAILELAEFVATCLLRGRRHVCIVHGQGHGSPGREPVLRVLVQRWLVSCPEVLACVQAPLTQGGAGAVRVVLRAWNKFKGRPEIEY